METIYRLYRHTQSEKQIHRCLIRFMSQHASSRVCLLGKRALSPATKAVVLKPNLRRARIIIAGVLRLS